MNRNLGFSAWLVSLSVALVLGIALIGYPAQASPSAGLSTIRPEDPVEVVGSALSDLAGVPIAELALYAYDGSTWAPIPFQIDERDSSNNYVASEDGLLDANDVLVFMARDAGSAAGLAQWPADAQARSANRQVIQAVDPLSGVSGMVYLYRSATLARSATSYVTWNQAGQTITTPAFTAAFDPNNFIGLADLHLHGGPDVLDRQKIRVSGKAFSIIPFSYNEEQIGNLGISGTITPTIQGPVRTMQVGSALNVAFYRERFAFETKLDTSGFPQGTIVENLRTSFDLNDPVTTGLTSFFDSNGSNAVIDGNPDTLTGNSIFQWYQVSGTPVGPGGMVVAFPNLDLGGGSAANYYSDNGNPDTNDTGDQKSYADTGLTINQPSGLAVITLAGMILPAGTTANVGQSVFNRTITSITTQVSAMPFVDPGAVRELYLPIVVR